MIIGEVISFCRHQGDVAC